MRGRDRYVGTILRKIGRDGAAWLSGLGIALLLVNRTRFDALTEDALATVDDARREALLQRATELAIGDTGVIPLHFQVNLWAARDGIAYVPRTDEFTLAWKFAPPTAK